MSKLQVSVALVAEVGAGSRILVKYLFVDVPSVDLLGRLLRGLSSFLRELFEFGTVG